MSGFNMSQKLSKLRAFFALTHSFKIRLDVYIPKSPQGSTPTVKKNGVQEKADPTILRPLWLLGP